MFDPERLLGQMLGGGLGGALGGGHYKKKKKNKAGYGSFGGLGGSMSTGTKAQLGVGLLGIAAADGVLEPAEVGLDRGRVAAVLEPLALGALDPLFLGGDVGHGRRG